MKYAALLPTTCGRLIKACGWSPIGKSVNFAVEEGLEPALVGKCFVGTISSLKEEGRAFIHTANGETLEIIARHEGYGLYYLPLGGIAAYLVAASPGDNRIAQGILTLRRRVKAGLG